ncbi:Cytosine/adenosine deaminase [Filimonas lacunae]|uniref:Cytosine/adenosine deaminase n=1 Tax=Filimonas lacunae TaxID=477680 RepID=A0A173MDC5_9BACT|nr:amidohydrolase family protein [Filimonas lacunae]BAV05565.1 chlorohydrolase family protein [Filimonas lacunae]SIT29354.1 Cytosine/adenosine deaminase [Filimonas lacunae]
MVLQQVYTIDGRRVNITLAQGLVAGITSAGMPAAAGVPQLHFHHHLVFPGLINSHDHLHFNLFPRLGNRLYPNYVAWGEDIHIHNKATIAAVLAVPKAMRTQWGVYKNLLNGVTTVVHHGESLQVPSPVMDVFTHCHSLHSVQLEKRWRYKLNNPFLPAHPFVIHVGEGTDAGSRQEIDRLMQWNILHRKLIGVHGVAMQPQQARAFAALVWCPDSNEFLLGATAAIDSLKRETAVLFGTDSTVSAHWSIWEHLRMARRTGMLTDAELMRSVWRAPAEVWGLPGKGMLTPGAVADLVVVKMKEGQEPGPDAFFAIEPQDIALVVKDGRIVLFDEALLPQLTWQQAHLQEYSKVFTANTGKYVWGDVPALLTGIRQYYADISFPIDLVS